MIQGTYSAVYKGAPIYGLVPNREYTITIEKSNSYVYNLTVDYCGDEFLDKMINYSSEGSIRYSWEIMSTEQNHNI